MSEKPWDGRFAEGTDTAVEAFTASIQTDRRLYPYDIEGSMAHCRMLAKVGVLSDEEASQLVEGLGRIKRDLDSGNFEFHDSLEDIHMHIESRLLQDVGKVAQKLHTARSRNDQVALDTRMFLRDAARQTIAGFLMRLRAILVDLAEAHLDTVMPGYTHLQRAQPVLLGHHWMAYYEMFSRDAERVTDCPRAHRCDAAGGRCTGRHHLPHRPQFYWPNCSIFPKYRPTALMRCQIGILLSSTLRRPVSAWFISAACPKSWCCGHLQNSLSSSCRMPLPRAAASCPRKRIRYSRTGSRQMRPGLR
jgi:hypothetical protein